MQLTEQLLCGGDLVGFFVDVDMREDQSEFCVERVQQLGCFAVSEIVEASLEHLSIKRDGTLRRPACTVQKARSMAAEYLLDVFRRRCRM